jgi:DNA polymerase III subunit delta
VKANLAEMTRALDAPPPHVKLFLLYGADESGSAALARRIERTLGADFERVDLDAATLKTDPARLADEAASFSLFGGKRYIRISPAGEEAVPAIEALLSLENAANPVIALAGALRGTSALLKLALAQSGVLALASYALEGEKADALAIALAREIGLRLPREIAREIVATSRNDRAIMSQELNKIALFLDAGPERPVDVTREAVEAIGASVGDAMVSGLADSVIGGRPEKAAGLISQMKHDGLSVVPMLRALQKRLALIAELRAEVEQGRSPGEVVDARGKAIFYKEKAGVIRDVTRWSSDQVALIATRLLQAERSVKSAANAGDVLAEAEIIRIARGAARLR